MEKKVIDITVDGKVHKVVSLDGHGHCTCRKCRLLTWTCFFYQYSVDSPILCYDCLVKCIQHKEDSSFARFLNSPNVE